MSAAERKSLRQPEESIDLPGIKQALVEIGGLSVARAVHDPGWRWYEHVRPLVGGEWCQARHVGLVLSGRMGVLFDDGRELEFGPDDVYDVPPGHDGWVVGDEPLVCIEWSGARAIAGAHAEFQDRVLTTLLFTDIVGSTETLVRMGDVAWRELLAVHHQSARAEIERFRGAYVESAGDGFLATFDAPARALRCAASVRAAANRAGLGVRAAAHVGEVVLTGEGIRGVAVHEAARIMAVAQPNEILASETTRALAEGAGLTFDDRGEHRLKGLEEPRRLYSLAAGELAS